MKIKFFNNLALRIRNTVKLFEISLYEDVLFCNNYASIEYLKGYSILHIDIDQSFSNLRNKVVLDFVKDFRLIPSIRVGFSIYNLETYYFDMEWLNFNYFSSSCRD